MRTRLAFALTGAVLGAVACSKFSDGKSTDDPVPPAHDAGSHAEAAAPTDSGADADPVDAGVVLPPGAFDDVTYEPFESFDHIEKPTDSTFPWSEQGDGDSPEITDDCDDPQMCSPDDDVHFQGGGSDTLGPWLESALASNEVFRLDFSIRFDPAADVEATQLVTIELEALRRYLYIDYFDGKLRMGDQFHNQGDPDDLYDSQQIVLDDPPRKWTKFRLYVNLQDHVMGLARNGVPYSAWRIREQILTTAPVQPKLRIGVTYQRTSTDFDLYFDDVGLKYY